MDGRILRGLKRRSPGLDLRDGRRGIYGCGVTAYDGDVGVVDLWVKGLEVDGILRSSHWVGHASWI